MLIQPYIHPPADRNRLIAPDPPVLSVARSDSEPIVGEGTLRWREWEDDLSDERSAMTATAHHTVPGSCDRT